MNKIPKFTATILLIATAASAAPTSQPASRPAADYSTPKATFQSFIAALRANDTAAAHACFDDTGDLCVQFVDAFLGLTVSTRKLQAAVQTHLGKALENMPEDPVDKVEAAYAHATVEVEDNRAWIIQGDETRKDAVQLKKTDAGWRIDSLKSYKLDTPDGMKAAHGLIESTPKTLEVLDSVTADIVSGKIKTLAEMKARLAH